MLDRRIPGVCIRHSKKELVFPGQFRQLLRLCQFYRQGLVADYVNALGQKSLGRCIMRGVGSNDDCKIDAIASFRLGCCHVFIRFIKPVISYAQLPARCERVFMIP